jgi:protein-disulfide isomerase
VAAASIEAFRQGRFLELADLAVARPGPVRARDLESVAARAGLDLEELRAALGDDRHQDQLERDALRREALGVGTIGLAWNGEAAPTPDLSLEAALRSYGRARARALERLRGGVPRAELFEVLASEARAERARRSDGPRAEAATSRVQVAIGDSPARGEPDAEVTVVVFTDFECSFCRRQAEVLRKLLHLYPRRVRLVYKHFPLARGGSARAAADVAECARNQGRFWEVHDLLLEGPVRRRERDLDQLVVAAGLDLERLRTDLPGCQARVDADVAQGKSLGVESTPTLFVNGLKLVGIRGLAELRLHVEDELAPGLLGGLTAGSP